MKAATRWVVALTGIGSLIAALYAVTVSTALITLRVQLGASIGQLEARSRDRGSSGRSAGAMAERIGERPLMAQPTNATTKVKPGRAQENDRLVRAAYDGYRAA
jgi:hypothetical protein